MGKRTRTETEDLDKDILELHRVVFELRKAVVVLHTAIRGLRTEVGEFNSRLRKVKRKQSPAVSHPSTPLPVPLSLEHQVEGRGGSGSKKEALNFRRRIEGVSPEAGDASEDGVKLLRGEEAQLEGRNDDGEEHPGCERRVKRPRLQSHPKGIVPRYGAQYWNFADDATQFHSPY